MTRYVINLVTNCFISIHICLKFAFPLAAEGFSRMAEGSVLLFAFEAIYSYLTPKKAHPKMFYSLIPQQFNITI